MKENEEEFFGIITVTTGILWLIGLTVYLIVAKEERKKMESLDIFLAYTGGTIGVSLFGPTLLALAIIIGVPILLIDVLRGRHKNWFLWHQKKEKK